MPARKNRIPKAVALRYNKDKRAAPVVTAKGYGSIAQKIIEIARSNGIHIHQDADMVEVLSKVEIGDEIPPYLYKAIAEILAFVYKLNRQYGEHRLDKRSGPR